MAAQPRTSPRGVHTTSARAGPRDGAGARGTGHRGADRDRRRGLSAVRSRLTLEERITAGVWGQDWRDTERELMGIWLSPPATFESLIQPRDVAPGPYAGDLAHVHRFAEARRR